MHPEGIPLHMGINYVVSPPLEISKRRHLAFLNALVEVGIDFNSANDSDQEIRVERKTPPLQIRVVAAVGAPVGQLLILAPHPNRSWESFGKETEAIVEAFSRTWKSQRQVLSCDSTIRYLYESSGDHAFKELWETKLRQSRNALSVFGRPVWGGGLRFVMRPVPNEEDPAQIEVKIESYLRDEKKVFVEVEFKWSQPKPPGVALDPMDRLKTVYEYIENQVTTFINEGRDE
jgi:hypothetical protein